jgi:hypothetical protein
MQTRDLNATFNDESAGVAVFCEQQGERVPVSRLNARSTNHSVLNVQRMQLLGYGGVAEHACTHCRASPEGAFDNRCVQILGSAHLHTCTVAGVEQVGWAADGSNRFHNPTAVEQSDSFNCSWVIPSKVAGINFCTRHQQFLYFPPPV